MARVLATLGEARLLEQDYDRARQYYQSAVLTAPGETGNQTSTRDQARAIVDALQTGPADREQIEQLFAQLSQSPRESSELSPRCRAQPRHARA